MTRLLLFGGNPRSVTEGAPGSGISTCMGEIAPLFRELGCEVHLVNYGRGTRDAPPETLPDGWILHSFESREGLARAAKGGAFDAAVSLADWPLDDEPGLPVASFAWFHPPRFGGRMIAAARMALPQPAWKVAPAIAHSMWTNAKPWRKDRARFARARVVLAVTEVLARALDRSTSGRARYQPPPIDAARWTPGPREARADERLVIGFLGDTASRQKGFPVLARAIAILATRVPDLRKRARLAVLTGKESPFLTSARRHVDVEMLPRRSRPELVGFYRSLDLYVHPAVYEEFGYALVEAGMCGAPALAADTHSAREILGRTDLPRAGDALAFARALEKWLADPARVGAAWRARERIAARYSREAARPFLKRNLDLLLAGGAPA